MNSVVEPLVQLSMSSTHDSLKDWRFEQEQQAANSQPAATALAVEPEPLVAEAPGTDEMVAQAVTGPVLGAPSPFWRIFTSTFVTIFLAEIGDKTQVSTLLMSAEFHQPWVVFLGAGTALVATTLIGVWVGQWLSARLSPRTLDIAAGIMLALISASLIWDVFHP